MRFFVVVVVAGLFVSEGCRKNDWGYLNGTVLLKGQPVGPGTIALEPIEGNRAGAMAQFGEDGKYKVISAGRKEGARTGEYRVTIHGGNDYGVEEGGQRPRTPIASRYENSKTSDLTVTIKPGTQNVDFDLKP